MIISDEQVKELINISLEYYALLSLIEARQVKQTKILDLLEEIENHQSEDLKVIG